MEFQVSSTGGYTENYINILKKYNFREEKVFKKIFPTDRKLREFTYFYITIKDLEELIKFINEIEQEIIVYDGAIEIYDDYRE